MSTLSYKTASANAKTVNKVWLLIDVQGQTLGRAASVISKLLRGKHKVNFTPHVDCGDNIVVINADKIQLTGKKWSQKTYIRHTGYPGGQRAVIAKDLMEKFPIRMVEMAIKGMLPKNRLGKAVYGNLYTYAGTEHKQMAQKPKPFSLENFNYIE